MGTPLVHSFFDKPTFTVTHIVADPATKEAVIIDSVMDYDPASGTLSHESADLLLALVREQGYVVRWILETHAHADHVTAAPYLQQVLGAKIAIGERIREVQAVFSSVFHLEDEAVHDGQYFDHLWKDGERFQVGSIEARVIDTPGHTPADVSYLIGDALFVGDTIFLQDYGTARCDFPGGNAETLFDSIQKLYTLPDETRMFLCHDYLPSARSDYRWETTIGTQRASNIHVPASASKETFVAQRTTRDATLGMPRLIIPSIQLNIRAGHLPKAESNGIVYLKVPVNGAFAKE